MSSTQSSLHPAAGNADALPDAHQDSAHHLTNTSLTPSVLSDVGNTNSGDNREQPKGLAIFFGDFISHAIDTEDLRAYLSGSPGRSHFTLTKNGGWSPSLQDHVLCHPSAETDGDLTVRVVDLRSQELVCVLNYSFNLTISSSHTLDNVGAVVLTTSILEATTIRTLGSLPNLQSLKVIAKRRMSAVSRPSLPLFHNLIELEVEGRIRDACRVLKACFKSQSRIRKFCVCSSSYESTERLDKLLLDLCPRVNHVSIIVLSGVKRKVLT
ncbi:uncharacterized protein EV420DRAFT_1635828 [Desarmillaria tabescens]|uniref:Uncharacterized protein n=1 Tax=Armillaria tabescens TaxID=1929756 RepID=A0AA39NJG8_ARMTA|nr:uncharacterized protein EV420DRAFT_1635828 [Desarmillaria tabescens]KAK0466788.1 hypothetical protein EV420DRAFT_1635828 [Desarmillaria tabescens]